MVHEIALMRLVAQRVAGPRLADPLAAARHLLAAQGQDAVGVVRSLALRTQSRSGQAVLDAYDSAVLVRSWPMRGTLHTLAAADLGWLLALAAGRPQAAAARRRSQLGIDEAAATTAQRVAEDLAPPGVVREELLAAFRAAGLPTDSGRGYHLIVELAHRAVLCQGPMRGGEQAFVLVEDWITDPHRITGDEALAELALRYVLGHGPATEADLARWAGLPLGMVRRGLAAVREQLDRIDVAGSEYWLDPALPDRFAAHRSEAESVHLLPGFDEMVLGYADRTATIAPDHAERIVPGNNGVFRPTVLVDGVAVGTWRRKRDAIEVEPFSPLSARVQASVQAAVEQLP